MRRTEETGAVAFHRVRRRAGWRRNKDALLQLRRHKRLALWASIGGKRRVSAKDERNPLAYGVERLKEADFRDEEAGISRSQFSGRCGYGSRC